MAERTEGPRNIQGAGAALFLLLHFFFFFFFVPTPVHFFVLFAQQHRRCHRRTRHGGNE